MKKIFTSLALFLCFNQVMQAYEYPEHYNYSSRECTEKQSDDSTEINKEDQQKESVSQKHHYRPKMYRKVMGGLLFGVGVATAIGIIGLFIQSIVHGSFIVPGLLCCLLIIPITACCVGFDQFGSE